MLRVGDRVRIKQSIEQCFVGKEAVIVRQSVSRLSYDVELLDCQGIPSYHGRVRRGFVEHKLELMEDWGTPLEQQIHSYLQQELHHD